MCCHWDGAGAPMQGRAAFATGVAVRTGVGVEAGVAVKVGVNVGAGVEVFEGVGAGGMQAERKSVKTIPSRQVLFIYSSLCR